MADQVHDLPGAVRPVAVLAVDCRAGGRKSSRSRRRSSCASSATGRSSPSRSHCWRPGCSSSASSAATCARSARRSPSPRACACSTGCAATGNAATRASAAPTSARSRRSTRRVISIPTSASTACTARCSTTMTTNARSMIQRRLKREKREALSSPAMRRADEKRKCLDLPDGRLRAVARQGRRSPAINEGMKKCPTRSRSPPSRQRPRPPRPAGRHREAGGPGRPDRCCRGTAATLVGQSLLAPAPAAAAKQSAGTSHLEPGQLDEYYVFHSGGQSGEVRVFGLPSMRELMRIPVFNRCSATGWGQTNESRKILTEGLTAETREFLATSGGIYHERRPAPPAYVVHRRHL